MSIANLRNEIARMRAAVGLDRCPCEAQEPSFAVVYLDNQIESPELDHCPKCGRCLNTVIEVELVEAASPDWFKERHGGFDADSLILKWRDYIDSENYSQTSPSRQQEGAEPEPGEDFF